MSHRRQRRLDCAALLVFASTPGTVTSPQETDPSDPFDHWAFRVPIAAAPPVVEAAEWSANPIDAFVAARHREIGLVSQPQADPQILLRRLYFDLIGLPPALDEIERFCADPSSKDYADVVDRLLDSAHHGERWARHFMDLWRYSDPWGLGDELRNSQKHLWHWRDWIVQSLNADRGYDQMLKEMLAADELYPDDLERLAATGFLARPYFKFNRSTWLDETVEHTAKAFLGLTLNCARCHEHKYDPIAQVDYYRFRAFFEPYQLRTDQVPGEIDFAKDGIARAFDCDLEAPTYLFLKGDERSPLTDQPLAPAVPAILGFGNLEITPVALPPTAHTPGLRPFVVENARRFAEQQVAAARAQLDAARGQLAAAESAATPVATTNIDAADQAAASLSIARMRLAAAEQEVRVVSARDAADRAKWLQQPGAQAAAVARAAASAERHHATLQAEADLAQARLVRLRSGAPGSADAEKNVSAASERLEKARANEESPGDQYQSIRGALKTLASNLETEESRLKSFPTTSTGRRTALANWLVDRRNPLTARVVVNHVWARHFGQPLVPTVFDFGRKGTPPSHPELLDWLAVDFMEHGWSLKRLHRWIVSSRTWRTSSSLSGAAAVNLERDPENRFLWRHPCKRLEAELIHDALLALSGDLDLRIGGPSVAANDTASRRRSLYFFQSHNEHNAFLTTFDAPSVLECYRRSESIVPQQALAMANSDLVLDAALRIADRIESTFADGDDSAFVGAAWRSILGCTPNANEQEACERALGRFAGLARSSSAADPIAKAQAALVHVLLNHNDFITVR